MLPTIINNIDYFPYVEPFQPFITHHSVGSIANRQFNIYIYIYSSIGRWRLMRLQFQNDNNKRRNKYTIILE